MVMFTWSEPRHEKTNNLHMRSKDADQLRGDHRHCFRYLDSTIHLLHKYKISSLYSSPEAVQPSLCQTWSETTLLVFSWRGSSDYVVIATFHWQNDLSRVMRKQTLWILTRSDTTRLYSYWRWLEAWNFVFRKKRYFTIQIAKTKALISFAVIFREADLRLCFRICRTLVFSWLGSHNNDDATS